MEYYDKRNDAKWRFLLSYTSHKMKLRRLRQQREEYLVLRGNTNTLGTPIQRGKTSDTTADIAVQILSTVDRIDRKIEEVYQAMSDITEYIETATIPEVDKLILTCRFVRGMSAERIYAEIDEESRGRAAMRKRINRIIDRLPEPKKRP